MNKLISLARALHNDEDGASLVEYVVLLGITLACGLGVIYTVGTWSGNKVIAVTGTTTTPVGSNTTTLGQ
jgi:Flp pilus assembly pilin Flp